MFLKTIHFISLVIMCAIQGVAFFCVCTPTAILNDLSISTAQRISCVSICQTASAITLLVMTAIGMYCLHTASVKAA